LGCEGQQQGFESNRPLSGVRVLALEQYATGPFATAQLVDLGADVIKIEDPLSGGDSARTVPPYGNEDSSVFFESFNRGKRSMTLALGTPSGREVFERLVEVSDAVFANVRGDVPDRLCIRYRHLSHRNSRIVCCFISAYGMDSTEQSAPGYDYVMQGRAGWMSLTGEPTAPPCKTGLSLVDYSTGLAATAAILAGVLGARDSGRGCDCDLSLFDTAVGMLTYLGAWHLTAGYEPSRVQNSAHPSLVPMQNFRTKDGWVVVACAKEKFWRRLVAALGRPELADDPRYARFSDRKEHVQPLLGELSACFVTQTTTHWLKVLGEADVPCSAVNDVASALADPLVRERGMVVSVDHPSLGTIHELGGLVRVGDFHPSTRRAPMLGEHTVEIMEELLGTDDAQFAELTASGAFGRRGEPRVAGIEAEKAP